MPCDSRRWFIRKSFGVWFPDGFRGNSCVSSTEDPPELRKRSKSDASMRTTPARKAPESSIFGIGRRGSVAAVQQRCTHEDKRSHTGPQDRPQKGLQPTMIYGAQPRHQFVFRFVPEEASKETPPRGSRTDHRKAQKPRHQFVLRFGLQTFFGPHVNSKISGHVSSKIPSGLAVAERSTVIASLDHM